MLFRSEEFGLSAVCDIWGAWFLVRTSFQRNQNVFSSRTHHVLWSRKALTIGTQLAVRIIEAQSSLDYSCAIAIPSRPLPYEQQGSTRFQIDTI